MTIFQPRRENVSTWTIPVRRLKEWAENELRPKAKKPMTAKVSTSPANGVHSAARQSNAVESRGKTRLAQSDFKLPPL